MSISRIFDLSRRSMAAYQRAMDATAHNIANASNPLYSRQRVVFGTENPQILGGMSWGTGVKIDQLLRVREQLTDSQIRTNNQKFYNNNERSSINGQIEVLLSEPSELGISTLMESFFSSWSELSVTPNSSSLRNDVIRSAEKLASKVNNVYEGLDIIKGDLLNDAKAKVTELNSLLSQVQSLNVQINEATLMGSAPNDLLDSRDAVIDELSKLVNITVSYDSNNAASISVGGVFAADAANSAEFKLTEINGKLSIATKDGSTAANINGGELFAVTDVYSNQIPKHQAKLDSVINTLVESVNNIHVTGYSITNPPGTGVNFFEGYENGVLKINADILDDPNNIAVSSDGTDGNGDIAVLIAGLNGSKVLGGSTLAESYSTLVSEIGNNKLSADQLAESSRLVLQQLETQKASNSGVSIDEEMTNMLMYQRSYDASAKMIRVADEMLQTILSLVR
jgi:flagellar hook-associated protein 1 FlgK